MRGGEGGKNESVDLLLRRMIYTARIIILLVRAIALDRFNGSLKRRCGNEELCTRVSSIIITIRSSPPTRVRIVLKRIFPYVRGVARAIRKLHSHWPLKSGAWFIGESLRSLNNSITRRILPEFFRTMRLPKCIQRFRTIFSLRLRRTIPSNCLDEIRVSRFRAEKRSNAFGTRGRASNRRLDRIKSLTRSFLADTHLKVARASTML